jgi:hypothetical protein
MPLHPISGLREQSDEPMQVDGAGGEAPASPMQMQMLSFIVENPSLVGLVGMSFEQYFFMKIDNFRIWTRTLVPTLA